MCFKCKNDRWKYSGTKTFGQIKSKFPWINDSGLGFWSLIGLVLCFILSMAISSISLLLGVLKIFSPSDWSWKCLLIWGKWLLNPLFTAFWVIVLLLVCSGQKQKNQSNKKAQRAQLERNKNCSKTSDKTFFFLEKVSFYAYQWCR